MSEQQAKLYDFLMRKHQTIQNQINSIPQLSIEEQSKLVDINQKYNAENQEKVNKLRSELMEVALQLKNMF